MYVVFLAGGIASGKSTVAHELELAGARRIDLDQLSRQVLEPGTPTTLAVADAFGRDLLDPTTGMLNRGLLARRAFASPEAAAQLEAIELPAITQLLANTLDEAARDGNAPACCVVEVPLLDRVQDMDQLADEVVVVCAPMAERRVRAIARGMDGNDFDARVANQPSDEWLRAHADTILENDGTAEELSSLVRCWWASREAAGWPARKGK